MRKNWMYIGAGFMVGVLATIFGFNTPTNSGEWATWVGAIGTIAAVGGAYFFGERQASAALRNEMLLRSMETKRRNSSILAITEAASTIVATIIPILQTPKIDRVQLFQNYNRRTLDGIHAALLVIPLHELGSREAVEAILNVSQAVVRFQDYMNEFLENLDNPVEDNLSQIHTIGAGGAINRGHIDLGKAFAKPTADVE